MPSALRDPLAIWGLAGIVFSVLALVAVGILTLANAGSRNLSLAAAALLATLIVYAVQARFELQRTTAVHIINLEYTLDQNTLMIRQWVYPMSSNPVTGWRMNAETGASAWLAAQNPAAFRFGSPPSLNDGRTLISDFAIFSLVSFSGANEFDWQLKSAQYRGRISGLSYQAQRISMPRDCTLFREADLRARLGFANNLFQGAPIMIIGGEICLPPHTIFNIDQQSVTLRNRMCQIEFRLDVPDLIMYGQPRSGGLVGNQQYLTRVLGFKVTTTFFALRSQHPESAKYQAWATRVAENTRVWFEE